MVRPSCPRGDLLLLPPIPDVVDERDLADGAEGGGMVVGGGSPRNDRSHSNHEPSPINVGLTAVEHDAYPTPSRDDVVGQPGGQDETPRRARGSQVGQDQRLGQARSQVVDPDHPSVRVWAARDDRVDRRAIRIRHNLYARNHVDPGSARRVELVIERISRIHGDRVIHRQHVLQDHAAAEHEQLGRDELEVAVGGAEGRVAATHLEECGWIVLQEDALREVIRGDRDLVELGVLIQDDLRALVGREQGDRVRNDGGCCRHGASYNVSHVCTKFMTFRGARPRHMPWCFCLNRGCWRIYDHVTIANRLYFHTVDRGLVLTAL